MPACYDKKGNSIPHTQFGQLYFMDSTVRQLAMLLANGKLMLAFWFINGDDFHVTRWNFADFPTNFEYLSEEQIVELLKVVPLLETAMINKTQFKLNAGRKVGNYNLAKCREITDISDKIFCKAFGLCNVWEEIELYYAQVVRTDFSLNDEDN